MTVRADVVVVGGGPAGAAAGYYLASAGHHVVVLEQTRFPRDKPCGDGLTPRAIRVLDDMGLRPGERGWQRVAGLRVHAGGTTRAAPVPPSRQWCDHGLVVRRRVLDQVLLEHAEAAGAVVRYGARGLRPRVEGGAVRGVVAAVGGGEAVVQAPWLVCAEGAAGTLRRALPRSHDPNQPRGFALRQYCAQGSERLGWFDVHVDLYDGPRLLPAYGWAFPTGDGAVNVGVGMLHTPRDGSGAGLREHLDRFVRRLATRGVVDPDAGFAERRGGRLFMGASIWPPHGAGYVLVGDAAGMVNPATGEGIAYALETGRLAAEHVHAALGTGRADLTGYEREVRRRYGPYFRLGRGTAMLIADPVRMERLVRGAMASERRFRFTATLLLNLNEDPARTLDQLAARGLARVAQLARWAPPAPDVAAAFPRAGGAPGVVEQGHAPASDGRGAGRRASR